MKHRSLQDRVLLPPLIDGKLLKRYKRFLADVALSTGEKVTAHCPNSGSMKGCCDAGSRVWLSISDNPHRKYPYTWELIKVPESMIGINTQVPNKLIKQVIKNGLIAELEGYQKVRAEVKISAHTRLDLMLEDTRQNTCYVEIKNCTLVEDGTAMFPDAVTTRGQKHLEALEFLVSKGYRAVIFFLIQRMDAKKFQPADDIDGEYGKKLRKAVRNGVEIITRDTMVTTEFISIGNRVPVVL